jgi:hypothetical protein
MIGLHPMELQLILGAKLEKASPSGFVGTPGVLVSNAPFQDIEERFCGLLALGFSDVRNDQIG